MPKIPLYEQQTSNTGPTKAINTNVNLIDTITDPGAMWRGIGKMSESMQHLGDKAAFVVQRARQMNDYDVHLALETRVQKNETEAIERMSDIEGKTGDDRIKAIDDYEAWKGKVDIFDLGSVNNDSSAMEQKLKKLGINEEQKARASLRMQNVWDRYTPYISRLKLEAREFNAVKSIQDSTNTSIEDLGRGIIKPEDAVQRITSSVAEKDLPPDKAQYLIDSNVQFATKTYLEREIGKNNKAVVKDVLAGKYDDYLVGAYDNEKVSSAGHNLITDFKQAAQKQDSINKANDVYSKYITGIKTDPFSKEVWENIKKEILNTDLTVQEKGLALDALGTERNKEQTLIREDREAGKTKESNEYYALVNSGDYKAAWEYLEKVKYLPQEDIYSKRNGLRGIGSVGDIKTLLDIKSHIMENPSDVEGNKKLIYDNYGSLGKEAEPLLTLALSNIKDFEAKATKRGYDFIESQVAPHNSLLGINNTPGENDNLKKAFDAFDELYRKVKSRDSDKFVDSKTMDEIARYVVEQYRPTKEQQKEWQRSSLGRGVHQRLDGETLQQYKDRTKGESKISTPKEEDLRNEAVSFIISQNAKLGKQMVLTNENIEIVKEYLRRRGK